MPLQTRYLQYHRYWLGLSGRERRVTIPSISSRAMSTAVTISSEPIDQQDKADTTSVAPPAGLTQRPPRVYHPFSPAVVALLMPASVFGVLARLGLQALGTYDGRSIFPLAYPQAVGCLVMGITLPLKDIIGD